MAADTLQYAHGENVSDTLSTSIGSTDTSIPVSSISKWNISGLGGVVIIDRGTASQEIAATTGVSGSSLVVPSGGRGLYGTTAVGHNSGATIESVPFAHDWNNVIASLTNIVKKADGNIDITKLGTSMYVADTGAANAYVATLVPAASSYTAGMVVRFKAANANTTTSTLNVNGLGAKTINRMDGATALVANDIKAGQIVTCVYDGTNFQMLSPIGRLIAEADITLSNNTTNDLSTSKHGFAPLAPNDTTKFLRGDATWATLPAGNTQYTYSNNGTNSTRSNAIILAGWTRMQGDGTHIYIQKSVSFGFTYTNADMAITSVGPNTTSSTITPATAAFDNPAVACYFGLGTTSFTIDLRQVNLAVIANTEYFVANFIVMGN